MKRNLFLTSIVILAICTLHVNGQTIQNKNFKQKMRDGVSSLEYSYKYYLDENNNEVLHGQFKAISMSMDSSLYGETKVYTLDCNYKNGVLDGKFKYTCKKRFFVGKKVMINGRVYTQIVHESRGDYTDVVTFDVCNNVMSGDINFETYGSLGSMIKCVGKVRNGVLEDGSKFYSKIGVYDEEIKENVHPINSDKAYNKTYVSSHEKYIDFLITYLDDHLNPRVYYPSFVTYTLDDLLGINNVEKYKKEDEDTYILLLEELQKRATYLTAEEKERLSQYKEEAVREKETRLNAAKAKTDSIRNNYNKSLNSLFNACEQVYYKYQWVLNAQISKEYFVITEALKYAPVIYDANIEQLIFDKIEPYLVGVASAIKAHPQRVSIADKVTDEDTMQQIYIKAKEEGEFYLSLLKDYENTISCIEKALQLQEDAKKIEVGYTKTTSDYSKPENFKRENCTKKIGKQKSLYEAYCLVGRDFNNTANIVNPDNMLPALEELSMVSSYLVQHIGEDTKEVEKELKKATTAKEVVAILKKYL